MQIRAFHKINFTKNRKLIKNALTRHNKKTKAFDLGLILRLFNNNPFTLQMSQRLFRLRIEMFFYAN